MKARIHSACIYLCLFFIASCSTGSEETKTLFDVSGETFTLHSHSITCIIDQKDTDSLLVGTSDGTILYFNTKSGAFNTIDTINQDPFTTVYDILSVDNSLYYASQDGGVRRIKNFSNGGNKKEILRIKQKESSYSPYKLLFDRDKNFLYASTSNGAYRWDLNIENNTYAQTLMDRRNKVDTSQVESFRLYGVIRDALNQGSLFFGEGGAYLYKDNDTTRLLRENGKSVWGLQGSDNTIYLLEDDGILLKGYRDNQVTKFKRKPRNFVIDKGYFYAVSDAAVDVFDNKSHNLLTINLPEDLSKPRNQSCRQIVLIKDHYLYVAPGGNNLYRIPLADYRVGKSAYSLCSNEKELFVLTKDDHDLYSVPYSRRENGRINIGSPRYLRSFERDKEIDLLATCGNALITKEDGNIVNHNWFNKTKNDTILYGERDNYKPDYWDTNSGTLFHGDREMVRAFSITGQLIRSFPYKPGEDELDNMVGSDYNPVCISMVNDNIVVGTLHGGVVYKNVSDSCSHYTKLLPSSAYSRIRDIKSIGDVVYVLDNCRLSWFVFTKDNQIAKSDTSTISLRTKPLSRWAPYINRIQPIDESSCYLFSDNSIFCTGIFLCQISKDGTKYDVVPIDEGRQVYDALLLGKNRQVIAGDQGLIIDGEPVALQEPYWVKKTIAEHWPKGFILSLIGFMIAIFIIVLSFYFYGKLHHKRALRKEEEEQKRKLNSWRGRKDKITSEDDADKLIEEIEADELRTSSFAKIVSSFKTDEVYPIRDAIIFTNVEKSLEGKEDLGELRDVLKYAKTESSKIVTEAYTEKINSWINKLEESIEKEEIRIRNEALTKEERMRNELIRNYREAFEKKYKKNGYVLTLFDVLTNEVLKDISNVDVLESNIKSFENEEEVSIIIKNGDNEEVWNRLSILDSIGVIIDDAYTIADPTAKGSNWATSDQDRINASIVALEDIIERYNIESDKAWKKMKSPVYLSWKDTVAFEDYLRNHKRTIQKDASEQIKIINDYEKEYQLHSSYNNAYLKIREILLDSFNKKCKGFFDSYAKEDKLDDAQHKSIFTSYKYDNSQFKQGVMMFPKHADNFVCKVLLDTDLSSRKSVWKGPLDETKEKKRSQRLHHLPNLAFLNYYGGLFGLIATAGLRMLEKESPKGRKPYNK